MKKLIDYRNKAKVATIATAVAAVVLVIIYFAVIDSAQRDYYATIAMFDSLYESAQEDLALATSGATIALALGAVCSAATGISLILWMAANLLIAYKTPDEPEGE